jgi:hypothetical protein
MNKTNDLIDRNGLLPMRMTCLLSSKSLEVKEEPRYQRAVADPRRQPYHCQDGARRSDKMAISPSAFDFEIISTSNALMASCKVNPSLSIKPPGSITSEAQLSTRVKEK